MENQEQERPKPPYISWRTFRTFIGHLREMPIPPTHVDRSVWSRWIEGSVGPQLMTALRYLRLISDEGGLTDEFSGLLHAPEDQEKEILRNIISTAYAPILGDLDLARATPNQLDERFERYGVTGDVKRKCYAFFLSAAQDVGISLSSLVQDRARTLRRAPRERKERLGQKPVPHSPAIENGARARQNGDPLAVIAATLPLIFNPTKMPDDVQQAWVKLFSWVKGQTVGP